MPEKNIKSFDEYMRRWFKRTAKHFLDDNMDFDESIDAAFEETGDEVVLDFEKEFIAQMLKRIFGK